MLEINETKRFLKDLAKVSKSSKPSTLKTIKENLKEALKYIQEQKPLPPKYEDHKMDRAYLGFRNCHILGDVVLVYQIDQENNVVNLNRIGSHSVLGLTESYSDTLRYSIVRYGRH